MRSKSLRVLVVFVGAALSVHSRAETIGPLLTTTPITHTLTDWAHPLVFQRFDSTLGTLTSVQLELSAALQTTLNVTNNSQEASNGDAQTRLRVYVQDAGLNLSSSPAMTILTDEFLYDLVAGGSTSSGLLTDSGSSDQLYSSADVLAAFSGPGTIALNAWTTTTTLLANTGGNTEAGQVTTASLTGQVTYFYNPIPVPEPASIALIMLGACAAAVAVRRRKRKA